MKRWWRRRTSQAIYEAVVDGHLFQIQSGSEVNIEVGGVESSSDPGLVSITPPTDFVGRPIFGRKDIVEHILGRVSDLNAASVDVLCGIGGSGKSTLAMLVADRAQAINIETWWINATSPENLHASMRQLMVKIGVQPERLRRCWSGKESAVEALWEFLLERESRWLIVIDGADDPATLAASDSLLRDGNGWLRRPPAGRGSILVTSRDSNQADWATWCSLYSLAHLDPADGAAVLVGYAGSKPGRVASAERLSRRLGGLPLALRLAGSLLQANSRISWPGSIATFDDYRKALDDSRMSEIFPELDDDSEADEDRVSRELVGRTWELSLRMLERRGVNAARPLLQLLAHFADNPLPVDVLKSDQIHNYHIVADIVQSSLRKTIEALADFGLVDIRAPADASGQTFLTLHPVVRDVSRYERGLRIDRTAYQSAAAIMIAERLQQLEQPGWELWPLWQELSLHSFYLLTEIRNNSKADATAVSAAAYSAHRAAKFLMRRAEYAEAIEQQRAALATYRRLVNNDDDEHLLFIKHDIAVSTQLLGDLSGAEAQLKKIYDQRIELYGHEDKRTLATLHAYADVLWQSGNLTGAESAYISILDVMAKVGKYSNNSVGTENNLVQALLEQGKYEDAAVHIESLFKRINVGDYDENIIAQARYSRARLRLAQGRYDEAISELRDVYEVHLRRLGKSHTITLTTGSEIGVALQESGRPREACEILKPTFELRRRKSGDNHYETLNTRHQLAVALHDADEREEAYRHYVATLSARNAIHGPSSHLTLATRFQLAVLLEESGQYVEAEREFREVLRGETEAIGYDHPSALMTRMRVVQYDIMHGLTAAGLAELEKILALRKQLLTPSHSLIRSTEEAIAAVRSIINNARH